MKAINRKVSIEQKVSVITCPKCEMAFSVNFIEETYSNSGDYYLVSQVPDSGAPFFCPYCGVDVNKT